MRSFGRELRLDKIVALADATLQRNAKKIRFIGRRNIRSNVTLSGAPPMVFDLKLRRDRRIRSSKS
jgi:hypothetical protein